MYADIAAHRAVRSWFLRLIVNVVICALLLSFANKEYVPIYSCVVITKYDNIRPRIWDKRDVILHDHVKQISRACIFW